MAEASSHTQRTTEGTGKGNAVVSRSSQVRTSGAAHEESMLSQVAKFREASGCVCHHSVELSVELRLSQLGEHSSSKQPPLQPWAAIAPALAAIAPKQRARCRSAAPRPAIQRTGDAGALLTACVS